MSSQANYKWKFKKDRKKCVKPYERPTSETWLTRVATTIKDTIIPNWMINVSNYLSSNIVPVTENNDLNELEERQVDEVNRRSVILDNEETEERENFPIDCPLMANTQNINLEEDRLNNKLKGTKRKISNLETDNSWTCPIASTSKAIGNEAREEDGSSSTENTASSTSGCSSLVPSHQYHLQRLCLPIDKEGLEKLRKDLLRKTRDVAVETDTKSMSGKNDDNSNKRSFLWSEPATSNRPNVSKLLTSSTLRRSKSPFYDGKTSFGGTSAKRARMVAPYNKSQRVAPLIRVKINENKKFDNSDNLSDAAKRILANIEKISSPLEDAKRIPLYGSINTNKYLIEPNKPFHRTTKNATSTPITSPSVSCKSTATSIDAPQLKWLFTESSKEEGITNKSLNLIPSNNLSSATAKLPNLQQAPGGGKIKSSSRLSKSGRVSSNLIGRGENQNTDYPELVNVPLPITNLPKFKFGSLENYKELSYVNADDINYHKSRPTTTIVKVPDDQQNLNDNEFEFSLPVPASQQFISITVNCKDVDMSSEKTKNKTKKLNEDDKTVPKDDSSKQNLVVQKAKRKISADILLDELEKEHEATKENSSNLSKNIEWTEPLKLSSDLYPSVSARMEKSESNKSGHNNNSKNIINISSKAETVARDPVTVDSNFSLKKSEPLSQSNTDSIFNKFKPLPGSWTCSTCLVNNSSDKLKCIACEVPKPGHNPVSTATPISPPKSFTSLTNDSTLKNDGFQKLFSNTTSSIEKENQNGSTNNKEFVFFASNGLKPSSSPITSFDKPATVEPLVNKSINFSSPFTASTITSTANDNLTASTDKEASKPLPKLSFDNQSVNFSSPLSDQAKDKAQSLNESKLQPVNIDQESSLKKSQSITCPISNLGDTSSSSIMNVETIDDKSFGSSTTKFDPKELGSSKYEKSSSQEAATFSSVNVFTFGNKTVTPASTSASLDTFSASTKPTTGFGFDKISAKSEGFTFGLDTKTSSTPSGFGFAKPALSSGANFSFGSHSNINNNNTNTNNNSNSNNNNNNNNLNSLATTSTFTKPSTDASKVNIFESRAKMPSLGFNTVETESSKGNENFKPSSFESNTSEVKFSMSGQSSQNTSQSSASKFFSLPSKTTAFPSVTTNSLSTLAPNTLTSTGTGTFSFGSSQNKPNSFSFTPKSTPPQPTAQQSAPIQSGFNFDVKSTAALPATTTSSSMMCSISSQPSFTFGNTALATSNQPSGFSFGQPSTSSNNQFVFGLPNNTPSTMSNVSSGIGSSAPELFKASNPFAPSAVNFSFGSASQAAQPGSTTQPEMGENAVFSFTGVASGTQSSQTIPAQPSSVSQMNFLQAPSFNFAGNSTSSQGTLFQFTANTTNDASSASARSRNYKKAKRRLGNN